MFSMFVACLANHVIRFQADVRLEDFSHDFCAKIDSIIIRFLKVTKKREQ